MKTGQNWLLAILAVLALTLTLSPTTHAQVQTAPDSLVGLDHIPFVVADFEQAVQLWRAIGFTIKPGPEHANGIRNGQIKFADGSGIELISAPAAVDELTSRYRQFMENAEGPAYFSLHARDMNALAAALKTGKYRTNNDNGLVTLDSRHLNYLFILSDNRAANDGPYLKHANTAYAMVRVWIATDRSKELADLLVALGGELTSRFVYAPEGTASKVITVANGEVLVLPENQQLTEDRQIVGATFLVSNITVLEQRLTIAQIPFIKAGSGNNSVVIAPSETHGMWLEFQE